jgi:thiamine-phosphate pyrophosphorylase
VTAAKVAERLRLYLVADPDQCAGDLEDVVAAGLRGGVTAVQLRWKTATDREILALAAKLASLCERHDALFVLNDRVDLALAASADGVHLGVDDLPLEIARRLGGPDFVIGFSPETDEQTASARVRGANYLGVGPIYGTASKSDAGPAIGLETIAQRVSIAGIPTIGIGGIAAANALPVIEAGAVGVAVVSAILKADDPEGAARDLSKALGT